MNTFLEQTAQDVALRFHCPACNAPYVVYERHLGRRTTCQKCNSVVTIALPVNGVVCQAPIAPPRATPAPPTPPAPRHPIRQPAQQNTKANSAVGGLAPWQVIVGAGACSLYPLLVFAWSILGAVTLRVACSLCMGRKSVPEFVKAWWVSVVVSLAKLLLILLGCAFSVALPDVTVPIILVAVFAWVFITGFVYHSTLRIPYGDSLLLFVVQGFVSLFLVGIPLSTLGLALYGISQYFG